MTNLKDDIKQAFLGSTGGMKRINASMLSKCTALAKTLHIQPQTMAEVWEAFSMNKDIHELTEHSWKSFRAELQKEIDRNPRHNNHTPMDDDDADTANKNNKANHEGAVAVRPGMGAKRRQVGSPETTGSLALVTPPTKRMTTAKDAKASLSNATAAVADTIASSAVDVVASSQTAPSPQASTNYTPPKYEERTGSGKVVVTLNPNNLPATTQSSATGQPKCGITYEHFATNIQKPYRHLFTTMEERARALDQHLVRLEDLLMERYKIMATQDSSGNANSSNSPTNGEEDDDNAIAPLEGVGVPRQEKICCIGRICNSAHEGRINLTSVVLEGSRHLGGARVEMDLSHLQQDKSTSFSLFPGQIIAVEGMNSTGRKMMAHRICEGAAHGPNKSTAKELLHYHHHEQYQNGMPLKLMTVCGPYTTSDNLNYDPLYDFLDIVLREKPDIVIMVGPFVDVRHKDIQSGNAALPLEDGAEFLVPFEAIFANKVAALLDDLFQQEKDLRTQFVLVPSLDDANAEWVYPQPPLQNHAFGKQQKARKIPGNEDVDVGSLGLDLIEAGTPETKNTEAPFRRVHCVSNPCTLQVNEIVIGVTGTDAIFHMSADETNGNLVPGSRLARISQHMLQQQSYYPLFPPAPGTNLDLKHMKQWNMPCQPDLLIVPSKLACFARPVLRDTVVVNPGHLSKNTTGGTYAVMDIHPMKRDELENAGGDDVELEHNIADRIRLEIRKI